MCMTIVRAKEEFKPVLEIRVVKTTSYGVQLEATSNFFEGPKVEVFGKDDIWIFKIPTV